ncbi:MAG: FecR domain-containing protein, partial [Rhodospirillales bacterium]|nr:FecR domain-containing protein [Rhodospirillales bacterium]
MDSPSVDGEASTIDPSGDQTAGVSGLTEPVQIAQAGSAAQAEPIGQIETVDGTVTAQRADGTEVTLQEGDPVYQGDVLETGPDGAVGIVFVDDSTFSLAEDALMTLDEMVYDPGTQEGAFKATLVQGVFSFISGQISKTDPDAMTIETPMAVIGIRGTTGAINLPAGDTLTVVLIADAGGTVGEITVFNDAGAQVLNAPFQATQVAGLNLPPSGTFTMSVEQFNSSFGKALAALPPSPAADNAPGDDQQGDTGGEEGEDGDNAEGDEGEEGEGEDGEGGEGEEGEGEEEAEEEPVEGEGEGPAAGEEGPGEGGPEGEVGSTDDSDLDLGIGGATPATQAAEEQGEGAGAAQLAAREQQQGSTAAQNEATKQLTGDEIPEGDEDVGRENTDEEQEGIAGDEDGGGNDGP